MSSTILDKINKLIALNKFEEAKSTLKNIIDKDEKNIEALKLLGLCNVNLELFTEGRKVFETVVKHKMDDATSWFYLASCYDHLNDFLHAKPAYLKVINLRNNYWDAYKNLGILCIRNNEPKIAFELATKALKLVHDDYLLYYIAGTSLLTTKNYKNSIPYFEKALELNSAHSQLCNNLGTAYLALQNYDKALENYTKAGELNPKNSITFYNIASIFQIQNKLEKACEYFQKAYSVENLEQYLVAYALCEFKSGQYDAAIRHYKKLISQHPEKHNFKYNLACCYQKIGENNFAINILEQLTLLNPKSKLMSQKLADLYIETDQQIKAKEVYEKIIAGGTVSPDIYYEYALICIKTGDTEIAEKILKKVIELNPEFAKARKDLGVIYLNKRLFDYAKDEFEQAYKLAPENFEVLFEYANFLQAISDFSKANNFYQKALEKAPLHHKISLFHALNLLSLNQPQEALHNIRVVLRTFPEDAFVLFTAGKIYHILKDFEKAQMMLIKSLEINQSSETKNLLALNYMELNEYEKANTIFIKLLNKNPINTNLLLNSAKCYLKLSQMDLAKEILKKILNIFPEMEEAKKLLEEIT